MSAERGRLVERIYQEAALRPASQREAFLIQACSDDAELRGEVERMLSAEAAVGSFLEVPAVKRVSSRRLAAGERIGAYEIASLLGAGGSACLKRRNLRERPVGIAGKRRQQLVAGGVVGSCGKDTSLPSPFTLATAMAPGAFPARLGPGPRDEN